MATEPNLGITLLEASQSQPEIVINEALYKLAALSPLRVLDKDLTAPPVAAAAPADGQRYIIPEGATGEWAPYVGCVALNINGTWHILVPAAGWLAYVIDEDAYYKFLPGSPTGWVTSGDLL